MRKAAFIIGIIGALGALLLGFKWMSDLNSDLGLVTQKMIDSGIGGKFAGELNELKTATYLLILCGVTGLVFSIMVLMSKLKREINAVILIAAGLLPLLFSAKALFGVPMVLAGLLAFVSKPKEVADPARA